MTEGQKNSDISGQEKVTVQVAAKALGVTVRTVRRYLESGKLTKIKEGKRTFVSAHDVRVMSVSLKDSEKGPGQEKRTADNITLPLAQYNELLLKIGQLEGENKALKKMIEDKRPWWKRWFKMRTT